jgi:hypothetical protein
MSVEPKKTAALEAVLSNTQMQEMITLEPGIRLILQIAADPEPRENRWIAYEALKRMSSPFVGYDARCSELQTCQQYDLLIDAIDALLPENEGGI